MLWYECSNTGVIGEVLEKVVVTKGRTGSSKRNASGDHSWASALVGRVKWKLAPRGELSAAHKRPPCDSTMERLIDSPMPVPWGFVVKNASKIWFACCGGSPLPVSHYASTIEVVAKSPGVSTVTSAQLAAVASTAVPSLALNGGGDPIVGLQQAGHLRNPEVVRYANRLSDLLFMLARAEEGTAVKPLTGRRLARRPVRPVRTRPAPRRRPRG